MYEWHFSSRLIRSLSIIFPVGSVESQVLGFFVVVVVLLHCSGFSDLCRVGRKCSVIPGKVGISSVFRMLWSQGINPAGECGGPWCSYL